MDFPQISTYRPRIFSQQMPGFSPDVNGRLPDFLTEGSWNGIPVAAFRHQYTIPEAGGTLAGQVNFDLSTLVIPAGFAPVQYRVSLNSSGRATVSTPRIGQYSRELFTHLLLFNFEREENPRPWLRPLAAHPCDLFVEEPMQGFRGTETCALLLTNSRNDQDYFQLYHYKGQVKVNQWRKENRYAAPKDEQLLMFGDDEAQESFFLTVLLPNNSLCYYFIRPHNVEAVLTEWHEQLYQAQHGEQPIMVAIDGPLYFIDDWGISFSEVMSLKIGSNPII